jgi:hypothetical protein
MCRTALASPHKCLVAPAVETKPEDEDEIGNSLNSMGESSSKLEALIHILEGLPFLSILFPFVFDLKDLLTSSDS